MPQSIPTSREEAIRRRLTRYRGSICRRGHDGIRLVSSRSCIECQRINRAKWRLEHHAEITEKRVADRKARPEHFRQLARNWRIRNLKHYQKYQRDYHRTYDAAYAKGVRRRNNINKPEDEVQAQ